MKNLTSDKIKFTKAGSLMAGDTEQGERSYRIQLLFVIQKAGYPGGLWETWQARVVALLTCGTLIDRGRPRGVGFFIFEIFTFYIQLTSFSQKRYHSCASWKQVSRCESPNHQTFGYSRSYITRVLVHV